LPVGREIDVHHLPNEFRNRRSVGLTIFTAMERDHRRGGRHQASTTLRGRTTAPEGEEKIRPAIHDQL
jgi:hypothetical protein